MPAGYLHAVQNAIEFTPASGATSPTSLLLTADDCVFLRAVSLAGDVVRESEWEFLLAHWHWSGPYGRERIGELIAAGALIQGTDGCFVPAHVAAAVAERLPLALHPPLLRLVGEMLAFEADSFERLRMGIRRLLAQPNEATILEACRRWAEREVGMAGPRGELFVEAIGAGRMSRRFRGEVARAVPELSRDGAGALGAWVARMWSSMRPAVVERAFAVRVAKDAEVLARVQEPMALRSVQSP